MSDMLALPFMQRALIAGVFVGFLASFYGVFIVQRKMSFLGSGLSHAAFGGVALGLLIGVEPIWIAMPYTIIIAVLIVFLKEKTSLGSDTVIGILFAVSVALGIIFISLKPGYTTDAFSYLFGSLLSVETWDLYISAALAVLTLGVFKLLWQRWAFATFDSELARTVQKNVLLDDYLLSVFTAVAVVISIKIVGIILIAAYLVIPAAAARLVSRTFFGMTLTSVLIGVFSSIAGLWLSYVLDFPSGATIIIVQAIVFLAALVLQKK